MGLLARIFGAVSREEMRGIRLDLTRPFWEVSGETDFAALFAALPDLLPSECVFYFEGIAHWRTGMVPARTRDSRARACRLWNYLAQAQSLPCCGDCGDE
jgi:hypothetical protein